MAASAPFAPAISAIIVAVKASAPAPTIVVVTAPPRVLMLIALTHPLVLHKIHRLVACVVLPAVPAPVLLVPRRHVQVNGLALDEHWRWHDDHRLRQHQRGLGIIANVDAAIHTRLGDTDRDADSGMGEGGCDSTGKQHQSNYFFHHRLSVEVTLKQRGTTPSCRPGEVSVR